MERIKIRTTILSDSVELNGLSQFQDQDVEIVTSLATTEPTKIERKPNFMRFAGVAGDRAPLLEELEDEIRANRDLDLRRQLEQ
jgi:hypothetical protein